MNAQTSIISPQENAVCKSIVVEASADHAFEVFTAGHGSWWPLQTHHIGKVPALTALIEPRAGGRWFERGDDGSECDWGKVLVWNPPHRLVLAWEIGADWQHEPGLKTEVEVRFVSEGPGKTRVELEHRKLDAYGDKAGMMQSILDSDGGWSGILQTYLSKVQGPGQTTEVLRPSTAA